MTECDELLAKVWRPNPDSAGSDVEQKELFLKELKKCNDGTSGTKGWKFLICNQQVCIEYFMEFYRLR